VCPGKQAINEISNFIISTTDNPNFFAMKPGHNRAPKAFIINVVEEIKASQAGVNSRLVLAKIIARADMVITPSERRNQEIK
jgi:hypothetical protein